MMVRKDVSGGRDRSGGRRGMKEKSNFLVGTWLRKIREDGIRYRAAPE